MTTAELSPLTRDEAERLTERIRTALDRVASAWSDLSERVQEAFERRADKALGYDSWAEYAEAELKPSSPLAVEVRREIVGLLSAQGMSTRAIAPAVGVSNKTVSKDREVLPRVTPADPRPVAPTYPVTDVTGWGDDEVADMLAADEAEQDAYAEQLREWEQRQAETRTTTGLDGKTYTRPVHPSRTAPRRSITDQFFDAAYDLSRAVEKVHRLTQDDRWTKNKEQIARKHGNDLLQAAELLQEIQRAMQNNSQGV